MQALSPKYKGQVLPVRLQGFITMIYSNQRPTPLRSCASFSTPQQKVIGKFYIKPTVISSKQLSNISDFQ